MSKLPNFEDGHSELETPVPFPNTEVKLLTLTALVPHKVPNNQAVFFDFLKIIKLSFIILFMKEKLSKTELVQKVKTFFSEIKNKSPREIKKIKKSAMGKNISLKENRKLFCKYCLNPYLGNEKVRIKNKIKSVECLHCKKISRWKINSS